MTTQIIRDENGVITIGNLCRIGSGRPSSPQFCVTNPTTYMTWTIRTLDENANMIDFIKNMKVTIAGVVQPPYNFDSPYDNAYRSNQTANGLAYFRLNGDFEPFTICSNQEFYLDIEYN